MSKLAYVLMALRNKQRGLTTVEYAVAGGLVAAAVIAGFLLLGGNIGTVITEIAGEVVENSGN